MLFRYVSKIAISLFTVTVSRVSNTIDNDVTIYLDDTVHDHATTTTTTTSDDLLSIILFPIHHCHPLLLLILHTPNRNPPRVSLVWIIVNPSVKGPRLPALLRPNIINTNSSSSAPSAAPADVSAPAEIERTLRNHMHPGRISASKQGLRRVLAR